MSVKWTNQISVMDNWFLLIHVVNISTLFIKYALWWQWYKVLFLYSSIILNGLVIPFQLISLFQILMSGVQGATKIKAPKSWTNVRTQDHALTCQLSMQQDELVRLSWYGKWSQIGDLISVIPNILVISYLLICYPPHPTITCKY